MADKKGIFCFRDKRFYYLETGDVDIHTHLERVKNTLVCKDLISLTDKSGQRGYKVMLLSEAKDENLEIVAIPVNGHIKKVSLSRVEKPLSSIWD